MLKKMLYWFDLRMESYGDRYNGKPVSKVQWNFIITTLQCCSRMNNGLKQYYADLLMLELLEQGRL